MALLTVGGPRKCPVEGCQVRAATQTVIQVYFYTGMSRYCDHTGGGKPPPPTVPPVQHAGDLAGAKRAEYHHFSVRQGGRYKETSDGGRGDAGECGYGLSGLHKTSSDAYLLQIYGAGLDGGGK